MAQTKSWEKVMHHKAEESKPSHGGRTQVGSLARPLADHIGKATCEAVENQTERGQRSSLSWLMLTSSDKGKAMAR